MHQLARASIGLLAVLALAACGGGGATNAPTTTAAGATNQPAGSNAPSGCSNATAAGAVQATIADFSFSPEPIAAKVGDTVTWTNNGPAKHTATLDSDASCSTGELEVAATAGITFATAGTFTYHCLIHSQMKGTVTVSP
jgi:plastocyanin